MPGKFPPDICTDILSRLPVEDLLRFRCVSKSWCHQIDSREFIKTHLKTSMDANSNVGLIFGGTHPDFLCSVSLDSLDAVVELDYPLKTDETVTHNIKVIGSCDGLLCLSNYDARVCLMNPSIREHRVLPFLALERRTKVETVWNCWSFGFGHDPVADDYKVVRLGQSLGLYEPFFESETMIYSLKSNKWKTTSGMSYVLGADQKMGVLLGDALHWFVSRIEALFKPCLIVAFGLGIEKYREVPGPVCVWNLDPSAIRLGLVGKWLSVAVIEGLRLDLWVMKEYGVQESWTKFVSFMPTPIPSLKVLRNLAFSKNGDELLLGIEAGNILWWNLKEKIVKKVEISTAVTPFVAELFQGSLVPLNANKELQTPAKKASSQKGKGKKKKKNRYKKNRDEFLAKGFNLKL